MTPRVSIVVPTRDTRDLVLGCLDALARASDREESEWIVVDDGSRDGTAEAVGARHPRARVVRQPESLGFAGAVNRGAAVGRGDVLFFLNSDAEVGPDTVARCLEQFARAPRLGIVGADLVAPDGEPQWSGGRAPDPVWLFALGSGGATMLRTLRGARPPRSGTDDGVDWVSGAAMMIRRELWGSLGGFDESFRFYAQDLDLCTRARAAGWTVAIARGARVVHRLGGTIGRRPGAASNGQHPALLWTDLVRWAGKHGGPASARSAAAALRSGGHLRLVARRAATPFVSGDARETWRRDTAAYEEAVAALASP